MVYQSTKAKIKPGNVDILIQIFTFRFTSRKSCRIKYLGKLLFWFTMPPSAGKCVSNSLRYPRRTAQIPHKIYERLHNVFGILSFSDVFFCTVNSTGIVKRLVGVFKFIFSSREDDLMWSRYIMTYIVVSNYEQIMNYLNSLYVSLLMCYIQWQWCHC